MVMRPYLQALHAFHSILLMNKRKWLLTMIGASLVSLFIWVTGDSILPPSMLQAAMRSYRRNESQVANTRYVTIIDYTKPVVVKRLWVIEVATGKVVLNSHVSHARNSGLLYASKLSSIEGSEMSCAGNFVTQDTYKGRFGYSLRVIGLDAGNSNTLRRNIVFHPHPVPIFSQGCWMTAPATNRRLIDLIKGGSLVYVAL